MVRTYQNENRLPPGPLIKTEKITQYNAKGTKSTHKSHKTFTIAAKYGVPFVSQFYVSHCQRQLKKMKTMKEVFLMILIDDKCLNGNHKHKSMSVWFFFFRVGSVH